MYDLIVVEPFDGYRRGQRISDQQVVKAVLASQHAAYVVKVPVAK